MEFAWPGSTVQSSMSTDALAALGASRKTKLFARWARSHNDSEEISLLLYMYNSNTFLWIQEEFFTMARWPCQPRHGSRFASITDCCLICQHLTLCSTDDGHNGDVDEALIESHQLW